MAYEVHLKEFDGPLDLLLHLIEEAKVDIKDIFVSEITNQYLSLMEELDELDMDTASEFITMAATLVYIKSRSLLPRPSREEEGEEDPEQALVRQLREYKLFKHAGEGLAALRERMAGIIARLPEEFVLPAQEYSLGDATSAELFAAFAGILRRTPGISEDSIARTVSADEFTIRRQLAWIRERLCAEKTITFVGLFTQSNTKIEKIVTFMALLDMITRGELVLHQKTPYGEITLVAGDIATHDEDYEYMDEID